MKNFGAPLRALDNFDSYACRGRNNVRAAQLSEHGNADALDVRDFKLADGQRTRPDRRPCRQGLARQPFEASVCARFSTVLGPGSDGYHEEHIHLDLAERRNNYKVCQWDVREPPPPARGASSKTTARRPIRRYRRRRSGDSARRGAVAAAASGGADRTCRCRVRAA